MALRLGDLFIGNFPKTQIFGARPEYYKQFGLKGHEGVDWGCPVGTQIISATDGIVVRDVDDPKSGNYGVHVVVWDKAQGCATWYCHLSSNSVETGDAVVRGQLIGISGNTGNTSGPHLHLNLCRTDANGNRIDTNNGYKGFINPLDKRTVTWEIKNPDKPVTIPSMSPDPNEAESQIKSLKDQVAVYKQQLQDLSTKLGVGSDFADIIGGVRKLTELEDQLAQRQTEMDTLGVEIVKNVETISNLTNEKLSLHKELVGLRVEKETCQKALDEAAKRIAILESSREIDKFTTSEIFAELLKRLFKRG